jgi:MFS family permease
VALLIATAPRVAGIAIFVILFGLGSGLFSIVGGTLPLEVFGRAAYGVHVGWMSAARQISTAFAPFVFALVMARVSVTAALLMITLAGAAGVAAYTAIASLTPKSREPDAR